MSIDRIYETVLGLLTKQNRIEFVSKELLNIQSNDDRVLYVYYLLKDLKLLPKALEVHKTEDVSIHYRNLGNQCFQKNRDFEAWQYYNLSLLHAPTLSDHFPLALANRSAVFFSLKKYKECSKDIKTVLAMKHPEKIRDKLYKRQAACEEAEHVQKCENDNGEEIENLLKMKGPTDSIYLCASSKLKVVSSEEMGRHVIAKEDINVGEVLVQEDPYFALVLKHQMLVCCNYCLSRNLNLLPCDTCCFALYCSKECKEQAWSEYHKVECLLMPTLISLEFAKLELLALRTVIKARTDHKSWQSLLMTISDAETNTKHRGCVKINDKLVFSSKYYSSIHTLATNIERRSISDIFQKCVSAAVFLSLLSDVSDFMNYDIDLERDVVRHCVAGCLLLHIMTSPTNMHGISSNTATKEGKYVNEISIASAPYAFHSLLNHSCAPNVVRFSKLGTSRMTMLALRPIKKGMQLFDNYGSHHALETRDKRQSTLLSQYKFTCVCEACINNWPTYFNLRPASNLPAHVLQTKHRLLTPNTVKALELGNKDTALELFKPLCDLMMELEPYSPSKEVADCQESLKQCISILQGLIPYGYGMVLEWKVVPTI